MNKLFIVGVSLFFPFAGLWTGTQKLALLVQYDSRFLGNPVCILSGTPVYLPWKYFTWYALYHVYIPELFKTTIIWPLGGLLLFIVILAIFRPKKPLDSHGSARWAGYQDLLKMDLISGSGVVVGMYDNTLIRGITSLIRTLENIKKEKVSYAEMSYDKRLAKEVDKKSDYLRVLQNKLDDLPQNVEAMNEIDAERLNQRRKWLQKNINVLSAWLDDPPRYSAKKNNPVKVYPWVWLYKQMFNLYVKLPHFYLRDNSNRHLAVVAPTRSGKGVGLIIPTLLGSWKESCIVNDIKSENWGITAGYRKKMGQVVIKFEPTAEDGSSARWNPLDELPIGTPAEVSLSQNLAAVLADYEGKGKPDHWTANAAVVISTVILHLKYAHYADPEHYPVSPNLYTVAAFLKANLVPEIDEETGEPVQIEVNGVWQEKIDPKGFVDTLETLMNFKHVPDQGIHIREWDTKKCEYTDRLFTPADLKAIYPDEPSLNVNPNVHPIIYQSFVEITSKPDNELGSIISTANTALKEYLDPILARNTSISDFCIDDVMNYRKPVTLYLVTPPSDLLRLAPIFRLFFEMMIRHHVKKIGEYDNGQAKTVYKHKCLLLMDEFSSLGNLQSFAATLSYIAGYGLKAFIINQGLPQIYNIYGKDNQILMNCNLQVFFAPNDNDTGQYAEKLLGQKTETVTNISESDGFSLFSKKNRSWSQTGRALMMADEVKRLGDKEIIAETGNPPVLTDKVKYYEDNYFRKKLRQAPVVSDVIRNPEINKNPAREALLNKKRANALAMSELQFSYDSARHLEKKGSE